MIGNVHTLAMPNQLAKTRSSEPPVLSLVALAVPIICGTVLLIFRYQNAAFLIGFLSFFLAVPSILLSSGSLVIRERPRWIAGLVFLANGLLIYSRTFIEVH